MEVQITVKKWSVRKDKETGVPKVTGTYAISAMGNELATQCFNDDYNSKKVPFSDELTRKLVAIEKDVIAEITALIK